MTFTEDDRKKLYEVWVWQKEQLNLSLAQVCLTLNLSVNEFANVLHGHTPITLSFLYQLSKIIEVDLFQALPSLHRATHLNPEKLILKSCLLLDGEVLDVAINANQVVIEYLCASTSTPHIEREGKPS